MKYLGLDAVRNCPDLDLNMIEKRGNANFLAHAWFASAVLSPAIKVALLGQGFNDFMGGSCCKWLEPFQVLFVLDCMFVKVDVFRLWPPW